MRTLEVEKDQVHRAYSPSPKVIREVVYKATIGDGLGDVRVGVKAMYSSPPCCR